jgi:hypothetical protein
MVVRGLGLAVVHDERQLAVRVSKVRKIPEPYDIILVCCDSQTSYICISEVISATSAGVVNPPAERS